jgi:integrase
MAVSKASLVQVQAWMGHAHIQTTTRYLHHRAQHSDAALLADAFRACLRERRRPMVNVAGVPSCGLRQRLSRYRLNLA